MMNKIVLALFVFCLSQSCLAVPPPNSNLIIAVEKSSPTSESSITPEADFLPSGDIIGAIYRKAIAKALHEKVSDLQGKLTRGENAIPAAMDILKYALFSSHAKETMKKITEHVLSLMSPELKQQAIDEGIFDESTTPMTKDE